MNTKKRIEKLNTNLILQEVKIDLVLKELKHYSILTDLNSNKKFRILLNDLQHYKNTYNCIYTQLNTFTAYQARQ